MQAYLDQGLQQMETLSACPAQAQDPGTQTWAAWQLNHQLDSKG